MTAVDTLLYLLHIAGLAVLVLAGLVTLAYGLAWATASGWTRGRATNRTDRDTLKGDW